MPTYELYALRIRPGVDRAERTRAWTHGELGEELSYPDGLNADQAADREQLIEAFTERLPSLRPRKVKRDSKDYSSRREAELREPTIWIEDGDLAIDVTPDVLAVEIEFGTSAADALFELRRTWPLLEYLDQEGFVLVDRTRRELLDVRSDAPVLFQQMREMNPAWKKAGALLLSPLRLYSTLKLYAFFALVTFVPLYLTWEVTLQLLGRSDRATPFVEGTGDALALLGMVLAFGGFSFWMARRFVRNRAARAEARRWLAGFTGAPSTASN